MGVKFGVEEGRGGEWTPVDSCSLHHHAKFHPNRCIVSPMRGEKPQNRPLINFYTGALHCGNKQTDKQKNSTFLAAPVVGEVLTPQNLAR